MYAHCSAGPEASGWYMTGRNTLCTAPAHPCLLLQVCDMVRSHGWEPRCVREGGGKEGALHFNLQADCTSTPAHPHNLLHACCQTPKQRSFLANSGPSRNHPSTSLLLQRLLHAVTVVLIACVWCKADCLCFMWQSTGRPLGSSGLGAWSSGGGAEANVWVKLRAKGP